LAFGSRGAVRRAYRGGQRFESPQLHHGFLWGFRAFQARFRQGEVVARSVDNVGRTDTPGRAH
jgi:hypothetical protein